MSHDQPVRNRIKAHRRVRAGDLVPHEWNFRLHPDAQRAALVPAPPPWIDAREVQGRGIYVTMIGY